MHASARPVSGVDLVADAQLEDQLNALALEGWRVHAVVPVDIAHDGVPRIKVVLGRSGDT